MEKKGITNCGIRVQVNTDTSIVLYCIYCINTIQADEIEDRKDIGRGERQTTGR